MFLHESFRIGMHHAILNEIDPVRVHLDRALPFVLLLHLLLHIGRLPGIPAGAAACQTDQDKQPCQDAACAHLIASFSPAIISCIVTSVPSPGMLCTESPLASP